MTLRVTVDQFSKSLTSEDDSLFCDMFNTSSNESLEKSRQLAEKIMNMIYDEGEKYDPIEWILAMAYGIDMMFEFMEYATSDHETK